MVDHLGFRENGTDTADLDGLRRTQRVRPDIVSCEAEITSCLLQECASTGSAFIIETECTYSPTLVNADSLDVLPTNIQNGTHTRKMVRHCQRMTCQLSNLRVAKRYHIAAVTRGGDICYLFFRDNSVHYKVIEHCGSD